MMIQFQYTFDDLKEAYATHRPKPSAAPAKLVDRIALVAGALIAVLALTLPYFTATQRPLLLDLIMPGIAIILFFTPVALYQVIKSHGVKGLFTAPGFRSIFGWVLIVLCLLLWLLLHHLTRADDAKVDASFAIWKAASGVLLPHTTWILLTGLLCWFVVRKNDKQLLAAWDTASGLHRPHTMTVTDAGLTFSELLARHELKWLAFDRVSESQNLFLIYVSDHLFHMVPKRAFATPREVDEFRAIIDNRITRRPTAFPVLPVAG